VIDYKTDKVLGPSLTARASFYTPQIQEYARAMSEITGRPVTEGHLVFLYPRKIVDVSTVHSEKN